MKTEWKVPAYEEDVKNIRAAILILADALYTRGVIGDLTFAGIEERLTAPHPDTAQTNPAQSAPTDPPPVQPE